MNPVEKAETALNRRLEQLQSNLRASTSDTLRRFLGQSLVVTIGLGEAMTDYVKTIGQYAQRRYGEIKDGNAALTAQHADLMKSGQELLERFKADPRDQALRKELERVQGAMESIQKSLRRGANALQRDLAPSMGTMEKIADAVRRFAEADQPETMKRAIGMMIAHVHELYASHPGSPPAESIDAAAWEKSAQNEIEHAKDFYEAYALTGYQMLRALAVMAATLSETPPQTAEQATHFANDSVAARLKEITLRFGAN